MRKNTGISESFRKISEFRRKTRFFDKYTFSTSQQLECQAVASYQKENNSEGCFSLYFGC
jgi:hypothetical protein